MGLALWNVNRSCPTREQAAASREYSAGGVVVRWVGERVEMAVIRPSGRNVVALPKGHLDQGETAETAAAREVNEETGLSVALEAPLGEVSYAYRARQKTIFKVVRFFLFRWVAGDIDALTEAMRKEVRVAWWLPMDEAIARLTYPGERRMAARARNALQMQRSDELRRL